MFPLLFIYNFLILYENHVIKATYFQELDLNSIFQLNLFKMVAFIVKCWKRLSMSDYALLTFFFVKILH